MMAPIFLNFPIRNAERPCGTSMSSAKVTLGLIGVDHIHQEIMKGMMMIWSEVQGMFSKRDVMEKKKIQAQTIAVKICGMTLLFLSLCFSGIMPSSNLAFATEKLNLGIVDSQHRKVVRRFSPLMKYLKLKGVNVGIVISSRSLAQMIKYFSSGKVSMMFESPYGALKMMDEANVVPILIREKSGVKQYNSVILVKKSSPIKTLSDLKGNVIAFEDSNSTSSYLIPSNLLATAGLTLKKSRKPIAGKVAYYFSKDDKNTMAHVRAGIANAGGIKKSEVVGKSEFRILVPESEYVPRHVVLVSSEVSYEKLKNVLLEMKTDSEGSKVLERIKTPTGFSKFDGDPVKIMNTTVRSALGL